MKRGSLFLVSTPIGNLKDISQRAIEILKSVNLIAAEDTRRTGLLLKQIGVKNRLVSYHEHNEEKSAQVLLRVMLDGGDVALASDAGTPLISDPGFRIVQLCIENSLEVIPIPGPSAVLAGLVASGLPTNRFCFEGYPPRSPGKLKKRLQELAEEKRTMVFFESGHRLKKTLAKMAEVFGQRQAYIGREITKKFEQSYRGSIADLQKAFEIDMPKGEFVLVVGGMPQDSGERH